MALRGHKFDDSKTETEEAFLKTVIAKVILFFLAVFGPTSFLFASYDYRVSCLLNEPGLNAAIGVDYNDYESEGRGSVFKQNRESGKFIDFEIKTTFSDHNMSSCQSDLLCSQALKNVSSLEYVYLIRSFVFGDDNYARLYLFKTRNGQSQKFYQLGFRSQVKACLSENLSF